MHHNRLRRERIIQRIVGIMHEAIVVGGHAPGARRAGTHLVGIVGRAADRMVTEDGAKGVAEFRHWAEVRCAMYMGGVGCRSGLMQGG